MTNHHFADIDSACYLQYRNYAIFVLIAFQWRGTTWIWSRFLSNVAKNSAPSAFLCTSAINTTSVENN